MGVRHDVAFDTFEEAFDHYIVLSDNGCWTWTGHLNEAGYGTYCLDGDNQRMHRWSWVRVNGPVPEGLVLDHLCRNRRCARPDHLEAVTQGENVRRGLTGWAIRTMCKSGLHDITTDDNVYRESSGSRTCLTCRRISKARYSRAYYHRNKQLTGTGAEQ